MKKVILAGLLAASVVTSVSAYDTKVITGFNSTNGAKTLSYHNVGMGSTKLILGVSSVINGDNRQNAGLALDGKIGASFATDLPVLNDFDIVTDFGKDADGNLWLGHNLSIEKSFLVKITDKFEAGLRATVLSYDFQNSILSVHPTIEPVVSMTVKI